MSFVNGHFGISPLAGWGGDQRDLLFEIIVELWFDKVEEESKEQDFRSTDMGSPPMLTVLGYEVVSKFRDVELNS